MRIYHRRIFIMLMGLALAGCAAMGPSGKMADSLSYVRKHKGEGMRRSLLRSEAELMEEAAKGFENDYTVIREPHALFAKAHSVELTYAYYFYPSTKSGYTDVEIMIASPWLKADDMNQFQNDQFFMSLGYINTRLQEDGYDPNIKQGSMLPLSTAAFWANREITLKLIEKGARQDLAINELNEIAKRNLPYLDRPNNRASHDKSLQAIEFLNTLAANQRTAKQTVEQTAELKALLQKKNMQGLRAFLDAHPESLSSIEDPQLRLRFTGPPELRITDILQLIKNKKKDALIIARINSTQAPYKQFTVDEMSELTKMGISDEVVAAMLAVTTEYNKEQKRLEEQQRIQAAQNQQLAHPNLQPVSQISPQSSQQQPPEANSAGECLKLAAALKVCDQSGGFIGITCASLARTQFNCPRL